MKRFFNIKKFCSIADKYIQYEITPDYTFAIMDRSGYIGCLIYDFYHSAYTGIVEEMQNMNVECCISSGIAEKMKDIAMAKEMMHSWRKSPVLLPIPFNGKQIYVNPLIISSDGLEPDDNMPMVSYVHKDFFAPFTYETICGTRCSLKPFVLGCIDCTGIVCPTRISELSVRILGNDLSYIAENIKDMSELL